MSHRANDVAIGLAVAWAQYHYGEDVVRGPRQGRIAELLVWSQDRGSWDAVTVDRGPVVDLAELGPGSWLRVPTSGPEMYAFADALVRATEIRAQSIHAARRVHSRSS